MPVQIQLRNGTAAQWTAANPTLAAGEVGIESDTKKQKFGDGTTAWNSLAYAGTVTSVTGTSPVSSSGGATPAISLSASYGDTQNPYASKTANYVLAAPNGSAGAPSFRALVSADIPTLNQNTTGTAAGLSSTLAVSSGGTGQTTYTDGQLLIGNSTGNTLTKATLTAGTNVTITNSAGGITIAASGGGGGSPGGSTTQVQYNNAGAFAGSANMTFDGTTLTAAGLAGPHNGTVGATTANTGAFTTLSASSTVSGTGFSTYLASPPAIGGTAPAAGTFTTAKAIAAATQDAVQLQGRAGGTSSYVATITPTTLTASRTFTLPDSAGTLLISGGDLGTPSAGVVTNLTGTASININGTVGATTANAGTFSSTVHKGATSGTITLTAPAVAGTQSYTLPTAVPAANGYALTSTTAGVMSWASVAGGSAATPTALGTVYGGSGSTTPFTTSLGYQASNNTTGANNTAVGYQALQTNTTGVGSTAVGYQALTASNRTTPDVNARNTAVGYTSGSAVTTGDQNTFVGYNSGAAVTTGFQNTCIGYIAGANGADLITGNNNVLVGYRPCPSVSSGTHQLVVSTNGASGKGNSTAFIDPNGGAAYQGNNSAAWSVTSDQRLKKNIVDNNVGLDAINAIQVRNFEYRLPEEVNSELDPTCAILKTGVQLGVIAQEIQAVLPDCVKQESTGVLSVDSDNLTWYTINAIKQLSAALDAANARIAALEAK